MKKIYLLDVNQHKDSFIVAKVDPRELVLLTDDIEVGAVQDAQRPLEEKHLQEIAAFVASDGELPSSVIISTKVNSLGNTLHKESETVTIQHDDGTEEKYTQYYMMFPETKEEFEQYKGTIDIIDGQHRIYSFSTKYRSADLKDSEPYEMLISIYELPVLAKRRMLFMTTNEKQKPVSANLLLYLRKTLDLLTDQEKTYYPMIESLNSENCSPLKDRIIMNAEKKSKGYQAKQLVKILGKTFPTSMLIGTEYANDDQKFDAICKYLQGWEKHYGLSFRTPGKETMTKISGLRYLLWLFPTFWNIAVTNQVKWDSDFFDQTISDMEKAMETDSLFADSMMFRSEGAITKAVEDTSSKYTQWKAKQTSTVFNPLG